MTRIKTQTRFVGAARLALALVLLVPVVSACGSKAFNFGGGSSSHVNNKTKFSSSKFGVAASPRMTTSGNVPKGGGRYQVGKPYKVAGNWYTPQEDPNYSAKGKASWYGPNFHGRQTANGEIFDQYALSAAHPTLPLPSYVRVTNLANNNSVIVRVNDRGPFAHGRVIDLSKKTAEMLDFHNAGVANVRVDYVGPAPLQGDDTRILMASLNAPSQLEQGGNSNIRVAMVDTPHPQQTKQVLPPVRTNLAQISSIFPQSAPTRQRLSDASSGKGTPVLGFSSNVDTVATSALFFAPPTQVTPSKLGDTFGSAANAALALSDSSVSFASEARQVDFNLGLFADAETINEVSLAFALLGAVEKVTLRQNERDVTQLRLSYLKPGVQNTDVLDLALEMGIRVNPM